MMMYNPETNEIAKPSELLSSVKAIMSVLQSIENYGMYCKLFVMCHQSIIFHILKICLCIEYLLKPHFYIVKPGYARIYLFLFMLQNIDHGYSLEPPWQSGSNLYPQSMF